MLKIGHKFQIPENALTQTFGILAKRGAGKTYTASVMVEEMLKADLQVIVLDPIGVWWGLRSSADGKRPGFPILVLGGERGDVPLEETGGEIASDLATEEGVSMVLDLSLLRKGAQARFVTSFAERLYHRNRRPLHIVIDEADSFAPQRPRKGQERMLGAVDDLVRRGRARGIGVTLVSQRSAVLNKDVLTQVEVLVALRTIAPQDRDAVEAWIKDHGTPEERRQVMSSLPSLPTGTAWFWSPEWLGVLQQVKVRQRETFDSSATPSLRKKMKRPKTLAEVDLNAVRRKMSAAVQRAEDSDPKRLRVRIRELEALLRRKEPQIPEIQIRELPILDPNLLRRFESGIGKVVEMGNKMASAINVVSKRISEDAADIEIATKRLKEIDDDPSKLVSGNEVDRRLAVADVKGLRAGERQMLLCLAQYQADLGGLTRQQLAVQSGYSKSGTFDTYVAQMKREGLCMSGDVIIVILPKGRNLLPGHLPPPRTGEELVKIFESKLRQGERRMLRVLFDAFPSVMTRQELAEKSGYTKSGTFDTYVAKLKRSLLIVKSSGGLMVTESLLLGGRN